MHEWALAEAVLDATASALQGRNPRCLRSVTVLVGELQAVDREIFDFALKTLLEDRPFRQAAFVLETDPAVFRCASCGRQWALSGMDALEADAREAIHFLPEAAHAFIRCPSCSSPDYAVCGGRGVSIREITLETGGDCA